jgi:hypothetical protein
MVPAPFPCPGFPGKGDASVFVRAVRYAAEKSMMSGRSTLGEGQVGIALPRKLK